MFKKDNVSFVVQGAIDKKITPLTLQSLRQYFPTSPVLLSTWEGEDVAGLDYDTLVLSPDPGFFYNYKTPGAKKNNVNRQIISTLMGLQKTQTEYVFKIRTDFLLNGEDFLTYWGKYNCFSEDYKVFEEKVFACCYFTRNPANKMPLPFHPSDLAFFGKTSDLIHLFDIPLMTEQEAYWDEKNFWGNRYRPEQHIFINYLRKRGKNIHCHSYDDDSEFNLSETEKYFASNFVLLTFEQFNLVPTKKVFSMEAHPRMFRSCYTHNEWLGLYQRYVDPDMTLSLTDPERIKIEQCYKRHKKYSLVGKMFSWFLPSKMLRRQIRYAVLKYFEKT